MKASRSGMETTAMRANEHGMETKEFRAPREPEESLEPTPETVAKRREQAKKESRAK